MSRQDKMHSTTSISDLNDDCLILIFRWLPVLDRVRNERVCRRWFGLLRKHSWSDCKSLWLDETMDAPTLMWERLRSRCERYVVAIIITTGLITRKKATRRRYDKRRLFF